jgi:hypothetical protein
MTKMLLTLLLFIGFTWGGQASITTTQISINEEEALEMEVRATVEDNLLKLTVTRDGDTKNFEVDLDDEEAVAALDDLLDEMDVAFNVRRVAAKHRCQMKVSKRGYLGVHVQELTGQLRNYFGIPDDQGVLVTEVVEDSPAETAGLKAGDVILKVGDEEIGSTRELTRTIRQTDPESTVALTIVRDRNEQQVTVTLGAVEVPGMAWSGKHPMKSMKRFKGGKMPPWRGMYFFHDDDEDEEDLGYYFPRSIPFPDYGELEKELDELREELERLKAEIEELK